MNNLKLIIKNALYFDGESLLIPHYSGEFWTVDCTEYKTIETLESEGYSEKFIAGAMDNCLEYKDVKYFRAEYSPIDTENMELISDLSSLEFTGELI